MRISDINSKFSIGTKFKTRGKYPRFCTIVDIFKTYNSKNELVKINYIATHKFNGQQLFDYSIVETTVAMGLISTL